MKILMVTSRVKTYALGYQNVFEPLFKLGHDIIWAADFSGFVADKSVIPCIVEQITINSNPFKICNWNAYKQICEIIKKYSIEAIYCSTPIGGFLARLAGKRMGVKPIIYAAHGFLFFNGAPFINRTVYKLEEVWLAYYTDALITIVEEDYQAAKKLHLRSGKLPYLIHGAGIKVGVKVAVDREEKRKGIGIPKDAFLIISAGDLNKNKNTEVMVRALKELNDSTVHYIACGVGSEQDSLLQLARDLRVEEQFHLLGYRTDVPELMSVSDAFVMMSFREGLPRSLMEAMDLGLPCIGSDTRGIRDLIEVDRGGYICNPRKPGEFARAISLLRNDLELRDSMGRYNHEKVKKYSYEIVRKELYDIYKEVLN